MSQQNFDEQLDILEPFYDNPDEHCCSAHRDEEGYCEICGAVIPGTYAYKNLYGCD